MSSDHHPRTPPLPGMMMITDSMGFFFTPSISDVWKPLRETNIHLRPCPKEVRSNPNYNKFQRGWVDLNTNLFVNLSLDILQRKRGTHFL